MNPFLSLSEIGINFFPALIILMSVNLIRKSKSGCDPWKHFYHVDR